MRWHGRLARLARDSPRKRLFFLLALVKQAGVCAYGRGRKIGLATFAEATTVATIPAMRTMGSVVARRAELAEIFQLRWDVLRPGRAIEAARFPGDLAPETVHVGAFDGARNIACATATRVAWEGRAAWQLRGMGVAADWQKRGVGQLVLEELLELVRAAAVDVSLIWCNAREEAVEFYQKQGWRVASEKFHIEDVGPHFKMMRELRAEALPDAARETSAS